MSGGRAPRPGIHARLAGRGVATFVLERVAQDQLPPVTPSETHAALSNATVGFWRKLARPVALHGPLARDGHRSALTLKLLTYAPTGALVAAPTTSLPEQLGGGRNWDYRYTWIRDAAFSLYALLRLGFTEEAAAFMNWLTGRFRDGPVGERAAADHVRHRRARRSAGGGAPDLEGYRGSHPVRIGNGAATSSSSTSTAS